MAAEKIFPCYHLILQTVNQVVY